MYLAAHSQVADAGPAPWAPAFLKITSRGQAVPPAQDLITVAGIVQAGP